MITNAKHLRPPAASRSAYDRYSLHLASATQTLTVLGTADELIEWLSDALVAVAQAESPETFTDEEA